MILLVNDNLKIFFAMITVTKGQWFPLTIGNISYAGAAFDLQGATEIGF